VARDRRVFGPIKAHDRFGKQDFHRPAAVRPFDRKLTAVNPVNAGGNIEPHQ